MKKSRIFALACAMLVFSSIFMSFSLVSPVKAADGVTTQLCLILDQTNSLSEANWTVIKEGTADAIRNDMPHDGTVELTVIVFLGYVYPPIAASVAIPPTVITADNFESVATAIENLPARPNPPVDQTCTADALYLGWHTMVASTNFTIASKHIINLATDGEPNIRNNNATVDWDSSGLVDYWDDVIDVVLNMTDGTGITELDMEGINIVNASRDWFKTWVLRPEPGIVAPPFTKAGWIRVINDTSMFATAISEKFQIIVGGPQLTIDKTGPATALPNQTFTYSITIMNVGGKNATTVVLNDTLPPEVQYRGSNPTGMTDDITHSINWSLPDIPPGGSVVVELTVQVNPDVLDGTVLTNFAKVSWYDYPGIPYGPVNDTWITTIGIPEHPVGGYVLEGSFATYFWLPVALAIVLALVATVIVQSNRYRLRL